MPLLKEQSSLYSMISHHFLLLKMSLLQPFHLYFVLKLICLVKIVLHWINLNFEVLKKLKQGDKNSNFILLHQLLYLFLCQVQSRQALYLLKPIKCKHQIYLLVVFQMNRFHDYSNWILHFHHVNLKSIFRLMKPCLDPHLAKLLAFL